MVALYYHLNCFRAEAARGTTTPLQGGNSFLLEMLECPSSIAAKFEESLNLSSHAANTLICAGLWFYTKLDSFISHTITRTAGAGPVR